MGFVHKILVFVALFADLVAEDFGTDFSVFESGLFENAEDLFLLQILAQRR